MRIFVALLFVINDIFLCSTLELWENPPFIKSEDKRVDFVIYDSTALLTIEEGIQPNFTLTYINYAGNIPPKLLAFYEGNNQHLGVKFERQNSSKKWALVVTKKISRKLLTWDRFYFDIAVGEVVHDVYIFVESSQKQPVCNCKNYKERYKRAAENDESWGDPPLLPSEDERIVYQMYSSTDFALTMDEGIEPPITVALFNYKGSTAPSLINFIEGSNAMLGAEIKRESEDENWELVVGNKIDYNLMQGVRFYFGAVLGTNTIFVSVYINNIDNHPPAIIPLTNPCTIEEKYVGPTDCLFDISDEDGWLQYITWVISGSRNEENLFNFEYEDKPTGNDTYLTTMRLHTIAELDYRTTAVHLFEWTVYDSGHNNGSVTVVVNVIDTPTTPPMWVTIFFSQQFDEKTEQSFVIAAIDGDFGVNDDIIYFLDGFEDWGDEVSINTTTGVITVTGINRDYYDREMYTFTAIAQEVHEPFFTNNQTITFYVIDINDHSPTFYDPEDGILTFEIREEMYTPLEKGVAVKDIDTGDNAIFNVVLQDSGETAYSSAFQIVPSQGYRDMVFSLSIIDSTLLDYEVEEWQNFTFEVFTQETMNTSHVDTMKITISLINWNDELPIFDEDEYSIAVNETIGLDELLITVHATDRDVGDSVVHTLVGTSTNRLLTIDPETGDIATIVERAFDYERQTEVILQVAATDTFEDDYGTPLHTTYAQVTVEVLDINDETPYITVQNLISVEENREDDTLLNTTITAIDEDTTANLVFSLDWESDATFATKNGRTVNISLYTGWLDVKTVNISENSQGFVRAELRVVELVANNTPDYEIFDTFYLRLKVVDLNQQVGDDTAYATLTINIVDLNDNAPEFTDSINANNTVIENVASGSVVGTITATDIDGPGYNEVTYFLKEIDQTPPGLIAINEETGLLTVSGEIDADDPPTWYLNYTVTATDGLWETPATIRIFIIDINDNTPEIQPHEPIVDVKEKSLTGTKVVELIATDMDRDPPHNVVWYSFSGSSTAEFREMFSIGQDDGVVVVDYKGDNVLDRDHGTKQFTITFRAADNFYQTGGSQNVADDTFDVTLLDINDQYPKILNNSITVAENMKAGDDIEAILYAFDEDEPDTINTKIEFTVIQILRENESAIEEELFEVSTDEDYKTGIGSLKVVNDLEGYYGTYTFVVRTSDFGVNPETGERNSFNNKLELTIEKFNFHAPVFVYPENGQRIFLAKSNIPNSQLYLFNGDPLPLIEADDQQGNKWNITFSLQAEDAEDSQIFLINNGEVYGQAKAMLQLANTPNLNSIYTLTITAEDHGNPPFTSSVTISIRFFDLDSLPVFPEDQRTINVQFTENVTGLEEYQDIVKASYNGEAEDWDEFKVYYLKLEDESEAFAVDLNTGRITLVEMLDREEVDSHVLKILASNSETMPNRWGEESVLTVMVEVLDVNDNPPHFNSSLFTAGISTVNSMGDQILQLYAYDLDISDYLTYMIEADSLEAFGNAISEIKEPFLVVADTGFITLNFRVQSNMNGYFSFGVIVEDSPPERHTDTAEVQIYIISDQYRIQFTFNNTLDTVNQLESTVKSILEEYFNNLTCNIESILRNTDDDGNPINTQTVVTVHFIDNELNKPVNRTDIESNLNDIDFLQRLYFAFYAYELQLMNYRGSQSSDSSFDLTPWFIGVTSALVVISVIMTTLFIMKIRTLSKRVKNLSTTKFGSQESGLNRMGIAAPNTNKNALEGSNPVYNEEKKMPDFDVSSVYSGDSDLIGVEDNPEFDMGMRQYDEQINNKERY